MQVKTEHGILNIGNKEKPALTVAIAPKTVPSYLFVGIGIGVLLGFAMGSVATLLVGEKSLLLLQHMWSRLTNAADNSDQVQFELLLQ